MKTILPTIAACFLVVLVLTFLPYPPALASAMDAGFTPEQIDLGLTLSFQRRLFFWGWNAILLTTLCTFVFTSIGRRLADRFLAWTGNRRVLAALGVGAVMTFVEEVLRLPFGIARHAHARAWELSNLELDGWLRDHFVALGIDLAGKIIVVVGFYALVIYLPRFWWLVAPLGGGALGAAYAFLLPIAINPLFNEFKPLSQTDWKDQEPRVRALIDKAGVPVQEILVMDASRQSNHGNAYFTGFGPTRRIVLYDNLFKKGYSEAQIQSILGHELGHWQHDHIVRGILLAIPVALAGCFLLDRILRGAMTRSPWNLQSSADPAGLPIEILFIYLATWAILPVQNYVSRQFETQADRAALELANQPEAFIEAEAKLAKDNKSNVAPTPWNVWLFSTHPPAVERIRMGKDWQKN
jgi:STE24 endopeptidase